MFEALPKDIQELVLNHLLANDFVGARELCLTYLKALDALTSEPTDNVVEPLSIHLPSQIEVLI